jgi:hypothetical protein
MGVIRITVPFLAICDRVDDSAGPQKSCQIAPQDWAEMAD